MMKWKTLAAMSICALSACATTATKHDAFFAGKNWSIPSFQQEYLEKAISDTTVINEYYDIKNSKGERIFLFPLELAAFHQSGGTPRLGRILARYTYDNGKPVFRSPSDMVIYLDRDQQLEHLDELLEVRNLYDKQVFDSPYSLAHFLGTGGTPETAKKLSTAKNDFGIQLFNHSEEIIVYSDKDPGVEWLDDILEVKTTDGYQLFGSGNVLKQLTKRVHPGVAAIQAQQYIERMPELERHQIVDLVTADVPLSYARNLLQHQDSIPWTGDGKRIGIAYNARVKEENIFPQKTPRALILLPKEDHNGAFGTAEAKRFIRELSEGINGPGYNIEIGVIASDQEIPYFIEREGPPIDLLVLGGHGTPETISLGGYPKKPDHLVIDKKDDLTELINRTSLHAQIFLWSCSTAGETKGSPIAEVISNQAPHRTLYASKHDFSAAAIKILQTNPFRIEIQEFSEPGTAIYQKDH